MCLNGCHHPFIFSIKTREKAPNVSLEFGKLYHHVRGEIILAGLKIFEAVPGVASEAPVSPSGFTMRHCRVVGAGITSERGGGCAKEGDEEDEYSVHVPWTLDVGFGKFLRLVDGSLLSSGDTKVWFVCGKKKTVGGEVSQSRKQDQKIKRRRIVERIEEGSQRGSSQRGS